MRKDTLRAVKRSVRKGFKMFSITVLGSSVAFWAPWAVCHVSAAGPVRFHTYLMMDENGDMARDENGKLIQLFDEKGNLLIQNDDVVHFLEAHTDEEGNNDLSAKEREFFLIDGKFYFDSDKEEEITDLSEVVPALFKYEGLSGGYSLEAENGTVTINPIETDGDPVYVARIAGSDEGLPAFTITDSGSVGYLTKGSIGEGDNTASFVYDNNNFYDEDMNILDKLDGVVPEETEDGPMFTGYYAKNGDDRHQIVDIDGSIMVSAGEYADMIGEDGAAQSEYCNVLKFSGNDADTLTVYSDMEDGSLYKDYQRTESFDNIGGAILAQLAYDEETNDERGHFAGYYKANPDDEDAPMIQIIDEGGNLLADNVGVLSGNEEYNARFYHKLTMVGGESEGELYYADGKWYKDTALLEEAEGIGDVIGDMPADEENEVYSEEKEMNGVQTKYFIGYYFETGFGADEDEEDQEQEMLLSDYDQENFDPYAVEINKVKFSDRDGNIVFDGSVSIDGDAIIYQNFYTVTVWDDGEVEVEDSAEEPEDEDKVATEEEDTDELTEEADEATDDATDDSSDDSQTSDDTSNSDDNQDNTDDASDNQDSDQTDNADDSSADTNDSDNSDYDSNDSGDASDSSDSQDAQDDASDNQDSQDNADQQDNQSDNADQQESQDDNADQQDNQSDNADQQESQDDNADQQESQDDNSDQQESQNDNADQQESQDNADQQDNQSDSADQQDGGSDTSSDESGSDDDQNHIEENAAPASTDAAVGEGPERKEDDDDDNGNVNIGAALPEDNENEGGE